MGPETGLLVILVQEIQQTGADSPPQIQEWKD